MDRLDGIAEAAEIIRLVKKYLSLDSRGKLLVWNMLNLTHDYVQKYGPDERKFDLYDYIWRDKSGA